MSSSGGPSGGGRGRGVGNPNNGKTVPQKRPAGTAPNEKSYILDPPQSHPKRRSPIQPAGNVQSQGSGTTQQKGPLEQKLPQPAGKTKPLPASGQIPPTYQMSSGAAAAGVKPSSGINAHPLPPLPPVPLTMSSPEDDLAGLVQEMDMEEHEKSTLPQASFNYINSIIGSGVIGMPYALQQAGVGFGIILMIVTAYITDYSLVLMIRSGRLGGTYTYQGIMEAAFGQIGFYILSLLQFIYPLIAMISYNIIVGDTLTKILIYFTSVRAEMLTLQREFVVFLATIFVTLPLSLYRDVARMAKISFISLVSIAFIMLSILIRLGDFHIPPTEDAWQFSNTGFIQAVGIFAFAFMCHHNTFMIYTSLKNRSEEKWNRVTHISIGTSLLISLIFAIGGYSTFTGMVQGDLLENYCWDDTLINVSRLLFCLTILLTFPLECFVARDVIENMFFAGKGKSSTTRHFSVTVFIVISAFIISMSTDCLGVVLELNGILAAMPLAYILPALCYLRLEPSKLMSREKFPAICTALFGILISFTGLIILITNGSSSSSSCSHGRSMPYCHNQPGSILPNGSIIYSDFNSYINTNNLTTILTTMTPKRATTKPPPFYPQLNPLYP